MMLNGPGTVCTPPPGTICGPPVGTSVGPRVGTSCGADVGTSCGPRVGTGGGPRVGTIGGDDRGVLSIVEGTFCTPPNEDSRRICCPLVSASVCVGELPGLATKSLPSRFQR